MSKHVLGLASEISPGTCKVYTVRGRQIGVFNIDNGYYGLINKCPHQGAPLCEGTIVSKLASGKPGDYGFASDTRMIRCPWHCWEFDIRTGESWCDPHSVRVRSFATEIETGEEIASQKLTAETVNVEIKKNYIVITL